MGEIALEEHAPVDSPEHVERWVSMVGTVPPTLRDETVGQLTDLHGRRLEVMDAAGIDLAVLSDAGSVQGLPDDATRERVAAGDARRLLRL